MVYTLIASFGWHNGCISIAIHWTSTQVACWLIRVHSSPVNYIITHHIIQIIGNKRTCASVFKMFTMSFMHESHRRGSCGSWGAKPTKTINDEASMESKQIFTCMLIIYTSAEVCEHVACLWDSFVIICSYSSSPSFPVIFFPLLRTFSTLDHPLSYFWGFGVLSRENSLLNVHLMMMMQLKTFLFQSCYGLHDWLHRFRLIVIVQCPCNSLLWQRHLNHAHSFIHSFMCPFSCRWYSEQFENCMTHHKRISAFNTAVNRSDRAAPCSHSVTYAAVLSTH